MRALLFAFAVLGVAAIVSVQTLQGVLATASGALLEAVPFLLAAAALRRLAGRRRWLAVLAGCGCGEPASARALPVTFATALAFGWPIALLRCTAAWGAAWALHRRSRRDTHASACRTLHETSLLDDLCAFLPSAVLAGMAMQLAGAIDVSAIWPPLQAGAGVALGFAGSTCALGAVAVASALHRTAPFACAGMLCVAGIADLRTIVPRPHPHTPAHDAGAYAVLALGCGIVAARHGATLVHPAFALPLAASAAIAGVLALRHRRQSLPTMWIAPAAIVAGALAGAPLPPYTATETTMTQLFAGERLDFTGALACDAAGCALVRYAITCCRADAAPVAIRLSQRVANPARNRWLRATGSVVSTPSDAPFLRVERLDTVPAPNDPFLYR